MMFAPYEPANKDIRQLIRDNKVYFYQIAMRMHRSESYFSHMLSEELDEEQKERIRLIVYDIVKSRDR